MRAIALVSLLMCAQVSAFAGDGFYVGAGFGQSSTDSVADGASLFGIGGSHFDSEETTWGALLGWNAKDWLAVEGGYQDLGNFGAEFGFSSVGFQPELALGIEEWSLGARFSAPVSSRVAANGFLGVSRVQFETQISAAPSGIPGIPLPGPFPPFPDPSPPGVIAVPFVSPEDETGLIWGFGFTWEVTDRIGLDLGYRRHDTRVLEIDAVSLEALFAL